MAYEAPQAWELRSVRGVRHGTKALEDSVMFWMQAKGVRSDGDYVRRPIRGTGNVLTLANASEHAVGRAWDAGVPNKAVGDELALRLMAAWAPLGLCELIWWDHRTTDGVNVQPYHGIDPHHSHVHTAVGIAMADNPSSHDDLVKWDSHFLFGV